MLKFYIFTSPSLATTLANDGIKVERVKNIYQPDRQAWRAAISRELCRSVREYCEIIGREVPQPIKDAERAYLATDARAFRQEKD